MRRTKRRRQKKKRKEQKPNLFFHLFVCETSRITDRVHHGCVHVKKRMCLCSCVTCTLDSLSDETPHEVGAVLTPVGAPERMNLV